MRRAYRHPDPERHSGPYRALSDTPQSNVAIKPGVFDRDDPSDPATALRGSRCEPCQETFFPYRRVCPRCRRAAPLPAVTLGRTGTVHAFTRVERTPAHIGAPYILGKVDLPGGVRILTRIEDTGDLRIGDKVELVIRPTFVTAAAERAWGYSFRCIAPTYTKDR